MTTTATIHDPERREFWLAVLGTDTVPIRSIVPTRAGLPDRPASYVYVLDVAKLTDQQRTDLLAALCQKFNTPNDEAARREFYENGVAIPIGDVSASTDELGLILSAIDEDEDGSVCSHCMNPLYGEELNRGVCDRCLDVMNDYDHIYDYDEFDDDDEYGRTYTCETCGGEYGDGWSTCTCYDDDVPTCRVCGCTDDYGCPGGCYWVEPDLCSQCADVRARTSQPEEKRS
jgi:hypothetical protein